ncbi:glycerophosphodiester phosphodiesterase family protein [Roseobacter litoralis]|uniref:glycerophosphodiester phosphodiesterase n=1 Tax=Roseobacter litoralis (strain ATCC 49566 / DSM 6996 / JCM 21268 / NBRC 15278 / OCh 149) TaxID=391595 RepID=F7ZI22_ROSLO|nr:glycerophosphodiester phosphodiesterase family protein [Roseobacter litoralis]AEI94972.1 putative glycerophosphoryl diester phosphodiesterase family protein [Roseobacter litoralis Och 149]
MLRPIVLAFVLGTPALADPITTGPRPLYLIDQMAPGPLRDKLLSCAGDPVQRTLFSIGHRGAPLQFPEHTVESNMAAARMGAGILECDVTFTSDKELVCRHAQNDLHTTTNILATDLAANCTAGFVPADGDAKASAECRTSDITLAEFRTLTGKMDAANTNARTVEEYMDGTAGWRTDLYAADGGDLMTHAESIALFKSLGAKFTPELKSPAVDMPYDGFTQEDYAQKLIDEYKSADIPASDVWAQSFNLDDVLYWIRAEPEFGAQAVYLDGSYRIDGWNPDAPETWTHQMDDLKAMGVNYIAPPTWVLMTLDGGKIVPTRYAIDARAAGIDIITWTMERSGPLQDGGGWYYQSIKDVINSDGVMYEVIDVLAQDVGVKGIFSDWPATISYYASCMGLE